MVISISDQLPIDSEQRKLGAVTLDVASGLFRLFRGRNASSVSASLETEKAKGTATYGKVSVGTSATLVVSSNANRKELRLVNADSNPIYIGNNASVTPANGFMLVHGVPFVDERTTDSWYAIVASGSGDLRFVEIT